LIEENVFDHNGWHDSIPGAEATIFNHNVYIQVGSTLPITFRANISANASSHGAQLRPGGTAIGNLFVHDPIGLLIATGATVSTNVFTEGNDISPSLPRGFGIDVNPSTAPMSIMNNIIAHEASGSPHGHGISLAVGTVGVTATNNIIYQWDNPIIDEGTSNTTSPNAINLSGYLDPKRTVGTYNASLGGLPTSSAFLTEARKQSKDYWRPQYTASAVNNYIRAGFGPSNSDTTPSVRQ
jgi:hypothetical protein